jgi:3-hydroxyacyl-CoA dehydrogenase/3a,7a,12a-trihydroxy-5b-cholest-24-enoyl-CoA hydratase
MNGSQVNRELAQGWCYPQVQTTHDQRDACLYGLGIGAGGDGLSPGHLTHVFEGAPGFAPFPTFVSACALNGLLALRRQGVWPPGLPPGPEGVLHGAHHVTLARPVPAQGTLHHQARVVEVLDKGRNALVLTETVTRDDLGEEVAVNAMTTGLLGAGGFGGPRGEGESGSGPPARPPDVVTEELTEPTRALVYRLSGDVNPLHADPAAATRTGLPRPVLHGMCLLGMVARHAVAAWAGGEAARLRQVRVRFSGPFYPGETLVTRLWRTSPGGGVLEAAAKERDVTVITHGQVAWAQE